MRVIGFGELSVLFWSWTSTSDETGSGRFLAWSQIVRWLEAWRDLVGMLFQRCRAGRMSDHLATCPCRQEIGRHPIPHLPCSTMLASCPSRNAHLTHPPPASAEPEYIQNTTDSAPAHAP